MCDTMGHLAPGGALFAKNSDRSPNEPQVTEWYPARRVTEGSLHTNYCRVEAVPETFAFVLSRPVWLWGGEMGVNEHGVCIGNEAVFTKGRYPKAGLTGMDLVRLALERADSAEAATEVIIGLLERHGQGGDCGYDHSFYYDNSFLIMDSTSLYTLETAGRQWAVKRHEQKAGISNRLAMGDDADRYSGGAAYDFAARHRDALYTHFSGSKHRLAQTNGCLAGIPGLRGMMAGLRTHRENVKHPLCEASVGSVCMHAGGAVGDHTTASWVVQVPPGEPPVLWLTSGSTPCIGLFKPWGFGNPAQGPVYPAGDPRAEACWREREAFHRAAIGKTLSEEFYRERDSLENGWIDAARGCDARALAGLTQQALAEEAAFYGRWTTQLPGEQGGKKRFLAYWGRKNEALGLPARPACKPL